MPYLLSCDPGKLQCGGAVFRDNILVWSTLARNEIDNPGSDGPKVWANTALTVSRAFKDLYYTTGTLLNHIYAGAPQHLVLEVPVVRRQGLQKGSQDDILALAGVDGAIAALFDCPATHYKPEQWKGTVDGDVMTRRILGAEGLKHCKFKPEEFDHKLKTRLSQEELKAIDLSVPKSLLHNVVDAIGLGLFYLGRLK